MYLSCEIALGTNDLLQPRPEPAAQPLGGHPGDVAEDLLGGGDQGPLCVVRGSVDISHRYDANKIVQHILITRELGRLTSVPWDQFVRRMDKTIAPTVHLSKKNIKFPFK